MHIKLLFALQLALLISGTSAAAAEQPSASSFFNFEAVRPLESSARVSEFIARQVAPESRRTVFSQGDPRWKDVYYARNATYGRYGCLVISLLMIYNEREGTDITPLSFADVLKRSGLVTVKGRLYWGKPIGNTNMVPRFLKIGGHAALEEARRQQAAGKSVIIEVQKSKSKHWMAVDRIVGNTVTTLDTDGGVIRDLAHYGGPKNITRIAVV